MFKLRVLHGSREVALPTGETVRTSKAAVAEVGELHAGDVIYLTSGMAGRVVAFWQTNDDLVIEMDAYGCVSDRTDMRDERIALRTFVNDSEVVDACVWSCSSEHIVHLCVPPSVLFLAP